VRRFLQHPGGDAKCVSVFHVLDSLQDDVDAKKEGKRLQNILLKHFEDAAFKEGRITTNFAKAIFIISPTIRCLTQMT